MFQISICPDKYQVKYATCTLLNSALTWWNSHKRTVGTEAAFAMSWRELMKLMAEVYYPINEIQKMESELWNLTVKNNDLAAYTQRFQKLTMMCTKMVPEEEDRVEKFIGGIPDNIQGNVIAAEPTRLQDVEVNQRDNRGQQPPFKRQNVEGQNVSRAYTAGNNEKRGYAGHLPYCNKFAVPATQRSPVVNQRVPTCFECGRQGHYRNECPKLKNQNRGKKAGKRPRKLEERLITLLDITLDTLDVSYVVELADERTSETNTVFRGCTLGLLVHPFNIDLMPVELGSFDVIIGMDWLANHHAVIVCDEKIVRIPYGNERLPNFLAQITKKETEDKLEEKRLEDVPIVRDFPEVFPKDLSGLSPMRQVEFQIDLVSGAAPVARAPYRLAPSEFQELPTQLQEISDKWFIRPSSSPWGSPVLFVKKKDGSFRMCIDYR
ncbi:putative reverse transcriptase domain-containing protein [Tanacetum coccineum]